MNTKLLQEIKKQILAEPLQFGMSSWAGKSDSSPCGTTCCIAGWAYVLDTQRRAKRNKKRVPTFGAVAKKIRGLGGLDVQPIAKRALGIDDDQAQRLFHAERWPAGVRSEYWNAWFLATYLQRRAQVAAERIDHFIATEGRE